VRDKDGVTAAVLFVEAAATLAASGRTVVDRLDEIALEHGLHVTKTVALRFDGTDAAARMAGVMARVRSDPPSRLAGLAVTRFDDLVRGGALPPTDAMLFELGQRARVIVRPSNTEPKVKIYLEVIAPTTQGSMADDRRVARELVTELEADLADRLGVTIA
jgi:phosphomannomutase